MKTRKQQLIMDSLITAITVIAHTITLILAIILLLFSLVVKLL